MRSKAALHLRCGVYFMRPFFLRDSTYVRLYSCSTCGERPGLMASVASRYTSASRTQASPESPRDYEEGQGARPSPSSGARVNRDSGLPSDAARAVAVAGNSEASPRWAVLQEEEGCALPAAVVRSSRAGAGAVRGVREREPG